MIVVVRHARDALGEAAGEAGEGAADLGVVPDESREDARTSKLA
jgi:hypothetical protein